MAQGVYGYAVDLERLRRAVGSGDLELLGTVRTRFASAIELNDRWLRTHGAGRELLPLSEALEWLIVEPPELFDDATTNVGYGLEILAYHLGAPIRLGKAGRSALRDMTLVEVSELLDAVEGVVGPSPLDGGLDLKRGLLVRSIAGIENRAAYPGTGYLKRNEIGRLARDLLSAKVPGALEEQPFYPFVRQLHGALDRGQDLTTFYY